jgi:hypothetical protein
MTAHTPGPWTMQVIRTTCGVCFKVGPFPWKADKLNHACIYADYPSSTFFSQCEANAQLIAAAPCLLAALKVLVESVSGVDQVSAVNEARAAIAKATGDKA